MLALLQTLVQILLAVVMTFLIRIAVMFMTSLWVHFKENIEKRGTK